MANIIAAVIPNVVPGIKGPSLNRRGQLGVQWLLLDGDPTIGVGTEAPVGSIASYNDGGVGTFWRKSGSGDTAWSQITGNILEDGSGTELTLGTIRDGYGLVRSGSSFVEASVSPAQTVNVAVSGGDYTTIEDALDYANTVASSTNRILISVYPGIYSENNPLTLPDYTCITVLGSHETTRMECLNPNGHGIVVGSDIEIHGLNIRNATGAGYAAFYIPDGTSDVEFHDCKWQDCDIGFLSESSGVNSLVMCRVPHVTGGTTTSAFKCMNGGYMLIDGATCTNDATITNFYHSTGANSYLVGNLTLVRGNSVTRASLTENTATTELQVYHADGCSEGHVVEATGGTLSLGSCQLTNVAGDHIRLANVGTVSCIINNCYLDTEKLNIGAAATFQGNYESSSATYQGPTVVGELWLGTSVAEQVPVSTYLRETASSGWVSGGIVSTNAGRVLDVTSGEGLVSTGTGVLNVAWAAVQVTATANSVFWVYVTGAGVVSIAVAEPSQETNILLATGYANATDIVYVAEHRLDVEHIVVHRHEYYTSVLGNIWVSGLAATLPGLLQIDVDSGTFYHKDYLNTVTGSAPITFTRWYRDGSGGWIPVTGQTNVDNANYDDNSGVLAAIPAGNWKKDQLFVSVGGDGTEFHLVYAQSTEANQAASEAAAIATPPDFLDDHALILAGPVVQQGAAAITSILDQRPVITAAGPGTAATPADHGSLAGLADDDHSQYLLLSGNAARNTFTGVVDFNGGTILIPTAANPAQTAEGSMIWDSDDDLLTIGDGASRKIMVDENSTQTLINKTLTTPTIADFTNAQHDHTNAANGGTVVSSSFSQESTQAGATSFGNTTPTNSDLSITANASLAGTNILIMARYEATFSVANQTAFVDLTIDGVKITGSEGTSTGAVNRAASCITFSLPVIAAGEVVRMRWWTNIGTITVGERSLIAIRMN